MNERVEGGRLAYGCGRVCGCPQLLEPGPRGLPLTTAVRRSFKGCLQARIRGASRLSVCRPVQRPAPLGVAVIGGSRGCPRSLRGGGRVFVLSFARSRGHACRRTTAGYAWRVRVGESVESPALGMRATWREIGEDVLPFDLHMRHGAPAVPMHVHPHQTGTNRCAGRRGSIGVERKPLSAQDGEECGHTARAAAYDRAKPLG